MGAFDDGMIITAGFFRRCIILKFYIRVFEAGIAFALVLAAVFALFKTQGADKTEDSEKKNILLFGRVSF